MRKKNNRKWYRHPKTHHEMVRNQDEPLVRARRKPHNLPNSYDDLHTFSSKTRKDYTKQKHRPGGRGKKHSIELGPDWKPIWLIEEYCRNHNIPFRTEKKIKSQIKKRWHTTKRVPWYTVPVYTTRWIDGVCTQIKTGRYRTVYRDEKCEPYYTTYKSREVIGFTFTWWSDKDIGIQYILKGKD